MLIEHGSDSRSYAVGRPREVGLTSVRVGSERHRAVTCTTLSTRVATPSRTGTSAPRPHKRRPPGPPRCHPFLLRGRNPATRPPDKLLTGFRQDEGQIAEDVAARKRVHNANELMSSIVAEALSSIWGVRLRRHKESPIGGSTPPYRPDRTTARSVNNIRSASCVRANWCCSD